MTQVLILFGVFLLALMLHYFVVMEGFEGTVKPAAPTAPGQTPFSELINKLTFFSTPPTPPPTPSTVTQPVTNTKKVGGAPVATAPTIINVSLGPKDIANQSISERTNKPLTPEKVNASVTNAIQQGKEYLKTGCKPKPTPGPKPGPTPGPNPGPNPGPDPECNSCKCPEPKPIPFPCNSSDYIRKDQIPCWGCSLK